MKTYFLNTLFLLCFVVGKAQMQKSIIVGYAIGTFNSNIDHSGDYFQVDQNNFQSKFNLGIQFKTQANTIYFIEYGQIYQRFSVDGETSESRFKIDQNKYIPSARVGLGTNFSILKKARKLWFIYFGAGIQSEFHSTDVLRNISGNENDYVELLTELQDKIVLTIQPEIALTSEMSKNKSFWKLGLRYTFPFSQNVAKGKFSHYLEKELVKNQNFEISGKMLSVFLQLEFNISKKK
ncbi:hypothetical protein [Aureivirga marina]|uniref:hypothetical protein n=1 Tax=Aureivirga marina TaxID=1182451 RepID=UPI0018CB22E4|nr:hypothetical protein [Aureivirga marina]